MEKALTNYVEKIYHLSHGFFFVKPKALLGIKAFFIKLSVSASVIFSREEKVRMSFLLSKNMRQRIMY